MKNLLLYGVWTLFLVSCSQMELPEMTGTSHFEESEWTIERVYFMDNGGRKVARVKREDLGGEWYFYKSVDKGEQIMMSTILDQLFHKDISEYPRVASTFTFADEVYRIHRYDEQTMTPQYHFLIISKK